MGWGDGWRVFPGSAKVNIKAAVFALRLHLPLDLFELGGRVSSSRPPAPSHHIALHVPTGSDRPGADRSAQRTGLTQRHTCWVVPCLPTGDADRGMCGTHGKDRDWRNMGPGFIFAFSKHKLDLSQTLPLQQ